MTGYRIDHVIIGARRGAELLALLRERYGFGATDRTVNSDGTASWLVPFDTPDVQYFELLEVADERRLAASDFGRLFLERTAAGPAFLNWAVATPDIERTAARLERVIGADPELIRGESVRADGQVLPWAEAAFAVSWETPSRPFFLEYGNIPARRERLPRDLSDAAHTTVPVEITGLTVRSTWPGLPDWLGDPTLPVTVSPEEREMVEAVRVRTRESEVEVRLR